MTAPTVEASSAAPCETESVTRVPSSTSMRYVPGIVGRMLPAGESMRTDPSASVSLSMAEPFQSRTIVSESSSTKSSFEFLSIRRRDAPFRRTSAREAASVQMRSPGRIGMLTLPGSGSGSAARCTLSSPSTKLRYAY
jgi:hypothetical protein